MRLIREARRIECETQRRKSRRSFFKKWLALSPSEDDQKIKGHKQKVHHALFSRCGARRAPVSPLTSSLKKGQSPFAVKWSSCIKALRFRASGNDQRRVRFVEREEEGNRPVNMTKEKVIHHHDVAEKSGDTVALTKQLVHRELRFAGQPQGTILQQGFLSLPVHAPFVQSKRYYCLLRGYRLQLYSSAAHATKKSGMKAEIIIFRVQDCQTLSIKKKVALFGASLPAQLGRMFYVIKANGERVVFTADTKTSKCNWLHSLTRLTFVGKGESSTVLPIRSRASSAPTKYILPPVPEFEKEEDFHDNFEYYESDRRKSCPADNR